MWYSFDNGSTIGTDGSENGVIIKDEEHELGARITLEKDTKYESIKQDIERLLKDLNDNNMSKLVEEFVNKY